MRIRIECEGHCDSFIETYLDSIHSVAELSRWFYPHQKGTIKVQATGLWSDIEAGRR